ncbi:hypothetical protein GCM10009760_55880 [Kitasatospora kazusensis]|uniref:Uncharacterized protein n=1 Tax=Kitasatospora kazusensis TaxID=407974 RepID=A0ABN3A8F6_9ACTN
MIFGSAGGMFQRGAGLAVEKRQAPVGDSLPAGRASPSRSQGGTHPGRISLAWNVVTPMGSGDTVSGKPTARKAQLPSGNRMIQKSQGRRPKGGRKPGLVASASAGRPEQLAGYGLCPDPKGC